MADLIKDNTDQMVVCPLVDTDWALVTSAVSDLAINLIINNGSDVDLSESATLTYSATAGGHKLVIPAAAITARGRYTCTISGSNIQNYILDGLIYEEDPIPSTTNVTVLIGTYNYNGTWYSYGDTFDCESTQATADIARGYLEATGA